MLAASLNCFIQSTSEDVKRITERLKCGIIRLDFPSSPKQTRGNYLKWNSSQVKQMKKHLICFLTARKSAWVGPRREIDMCTLCQILNVRSQKLKHRNDLSASRNESWNIYDLFEIQHMDLILKCWLIEETFDVIFPENLSCLLSLLRLISMHRHNCDFSGCWPNFIIPICVRSHLDRREWHNTANI